MSPTTVSIRGGQYAIVNASDLLLSDLLEILVAGAKGKKSRGAIADIIATACPDIPPELVTYATEQSFTMALDSDEIGVFTGGLTIATLKAKLERLQSEVVAPENKAKLAAKIRELKETIKTTEDNLEKAHIELLLGNPPRDTPSKFDIKPQVAVSPDEVLYPLAETTDTKISDLENQLARLRQRPIKSSQ